MRNSFRDTKPGGFKGARGTRKPAGGNFKERGFAGSFGQAPTAMHKATCAQCNSVCEVPFKPNGRKPVLCSMCFKNDGESDQKRPRGASSSRPQFNDRPQPGSFGNRGTDRQGDELKKINAKLDAILKLLS